MRKYIGMGMQFILSGSDFSFMMAGATARAGFLRSVAPKKAKRAAGKKSKRNSR
jgi:hypothetical protein